MEVPATKTLHVGRDISMAEALNLVQLGQAEIRGTVKYTPAPMSDEQLAEIRAYAKTLPPSTKTRGYMMWLVQTLEHIRKGEPVGQ